ncbi:MAG: glycosyltransferase [Candidatus Omnitrophica bacterium]|nr:glycosyltransferase [Candidatus Omnitrophota bacterium]
MANNPLVSVIIPMFNAENTVRETIRSVQAQTYQNWEMLVVDNRSTDRSRDVLKEIIQQDSRIRLIESDYNSGGPARPRNIGIRNALGKYLAFLDSDDLWLPDKLKLGVDFLENNNDYFLVYSKCFIKTNGKISGITPQKANAGNVFNRLYLELNFIACLTVMMVNQKNSEQYFFPEDKRFITVEDYILWLSIARKHKIGFIDEPLAIYVLHGNNLSGGLFKIFRCTKAVIDEFAPFVPKGILIATYFSFYLKFINMGSRQILKQAATRLIK